MTQISDKRRGDITELELCHHFLNQGFEVYKNVSCTGAIDFIVLNNETNEFTFYDSKTANVSIREDGSRRINCSATTPRQKELGVQVVVIHEGELYSDPNRVGVVLDEDSKTSCG